MFGRVVYYNTNASACSSLFAMLAILIILGDEMERKVYLQPNGGNCVYNR